MRYADSNCRFEKVYAPEEAYRIVGPCVVTGKEYTVYVPAAELFAYRQGRLIRSALPSVSDDDREFLISGLSPEGWRRTFEGGE